MEKSELTKNGAVVSLRHHAGCYGCYGCTVLPLQLSVPAKNQALLMRYIDLLSEEEHNIMIFPSLLAN